jgi:hypothetical protein
MIGSSAHSRADFAREPAEFLIMVAGLVNGHGVRRPRAILPVVMAVQPDVLALIARQDGLITTVHPTSRSRECYGCDSADTRQHQPAVYRV